YGNGSYYFDVGPHIPPRFHKIWNDLCERVNSINIPLPIKVNIKLKPGFDLVFPPDLRIIKNLKINNILQLIKYIFSYSITSKLKVKEKNLEDSLINSWGLKFFQDHMYPFISNFWKFDISNMSKDYKARVTPPRIRDTIQQIFELITKRDFKSNTHNLESKISIKNKSKFRNFYLYPKFGCKGVIDFLRDDIILNNGIIKTNSIITELNPSNNHIEIQYTQGKKVYTEVFDKIYWAASILDLIKVLKLKNYNKLKYRKLLTINISINKKDLLGDNVHASYIMIPNILFHRIYEPNKISPYMTPKNKTSACLEITLEKKITNPTVLVKKSLNQFCLLYNLKKSEIKYLGTNYYEEAYPLLFVDYNKDIGRLKEALKMKTSNISLIGRTGQYFPYNVVETLNSTW
ncbi:MAG: hypothetical protein KJI71_02595, partial [Patescibacteria group bacterium]|nr:hypothetical protein [Patescibacteria group bacterium]